jgi:hypothetical protein
MALFLRPASDASPRCPDTATLARTPGPRPLDFQPPIEKEMDALVACLEERRSEDR